MQGKLKRLEQGYNSLLGNLPIGPIFLVSEMLPSLCFTLEGQCQGHLSNHAKALVVLALGKALLLA